MPVTLNIIESTTDLGIEVVEVVLESASAPGPAGPGVPAGGTVNQVLTKDSGTDYDTSWQDAQGGGGGAPTDVDYLVGTASGSLSAEIVVGTSPGGELGGTWASPTVDATHSGSSHAAVQAAAEATAAAALSSHESDQTNVHGIADTTALALTANHPSNATFNDHSARHEDGGADEISVAGLSGLLADAQTPLSHNHAGEDITSGTVADARIASTIARDSEVTSAIATHEADTTSVHGIADTSALALTANHPSNATFNDHSARHENGGADEISIAGLDGTPTELTNHLNDTTAAHAASAIGFTPTGSLAADDVAEALAELDTEKTTPAAALSAAQTEIADQKRVAVIQVSDPNGDAITTGDGKAFFSVPNLINGHNLVAVAASLTTVSSSGNPLIQIHNLTQTADMLSTRIQIDANELHSKDAAAAVIDTGNDDVAYGDLLRVDIDTAGTGAKGLFVILTFEAP